MKILVCSRQEMRSQYYTDKNWYNDKNKYFISIAGIADGCVYPCPMLTSDSPHVLHLLFDDVTEKHFQEYGDNGSLILFNQEHAKKIVDFVKSIPQNSLTVLYINCAAGISRSGAVGSCLNEYFNNDNVEDFENFKKVNSQIQPNPYVKRVLTEELFGKKNWEEIFKNRFTKE